MRGARGLVWTLVAPHRGRAVVALVLMALGNALLLMLPRWSSVLFETVFPGGDPGALARHLALGLAIVLGATLVGFVHDYLVHRINHRVTARLRERLFAHVLSLPLPSISRRSTGELVTRFSAEIEVVRMGLNAALASFVPDAVRAAVFLAAMFVVSWQLSLVTLVAVVPLIAAIALFERGMRVRTHRARTAVAALMASWSGVLAGIREVKSFVRERAIGDRLTEQSRATRDTEFDQDLIVALHPHVVSVITAVAVVALVIAAAWMRRLDWITAETLARFLPCLLLAISGLQGVARTVSPVSRLVVVLDRFDALLDEPGEADTDRALPALPALAGALRLEDVSFGYEASGFRLGPITVSVPTHETVAIVGPSGAGKSTLLDLICRFRDPDRGVITIDGLDTRSHRRESLRRQIGLVPQEPVLLEGTLRENIMLGAPGASSIDFDRVTRTARVEEFASELPGGYDARLGGHGVTLSVGQRQRVALARALLPDPPVLLLDEPTSALDPESERAVRDALAQACRGRTTLIVAHRLSTIAHADRILVLDSGAIVEDDSHERLLERRGLYHLLHTGRGDAGASS